ncbi:MAG TPA: hypothetical protein VNP98_08400 [Chthoniobacterales bacterium]|nr:hypothetical protein [Chthoniobacterales bacterium]
MITHLFRLLAFAAALCVSSTTYAEGQRLWSRGFSSEPANSIDRAREFVLFSVAQGELNLVGTWSYTNGAVGNEPPPRVVIEGTKTADGSFWPDVALEVRKGRTGNWERIAPSPNLGERATVTIEPNAINFDLMVNLDPFKPLLDKYKSGRIVLNTGRISEFELKDLLPPGREGASKGEPAERHQVILTSGPGSVVAETPPSGAPISRAEIQRISRVIRGVTKKPILMIASVLEDSYVPGAITGNAYEVDTKIGSYVLRRTVAGVGGLVPINDLAQAIALWSRV